MVKGIKIWLVACILAIAGTSFTGCSSDDYDDTEIKQQISSLDQRVSAMEKTVNALNVEINQIKVIVEKLQANISIQSYISIENGYRIVFTDGTSIDVKNGKDGKDGEDGKDGQDGTDGKDGKDGQTPIIGVSLDIDGNYYWTVTINGVTNYIIDGDGNKISISGPNVITPIIKIDVNGYWVISYDGGITFVYIYDDNGNMVPINGGGDSNVSYIKTTYQYDNYVVFVLYNGQEIRCPIYKGMYMTLSNTTVNLDNHPVTISYSISGADGYTFVETVDKGNVKSTVNASSSYYGTITITQTGDIDSDTKVLVFLCNRDQTITNVIKVTGGSYEEPDNRIEDVVPEDIVKKLDPYITIYRGVNPPNVEGAYRIDPMLTVYCEDEGNGGFNPGTKVTSEDIRLYGQNKINNTINYEEYTVSGSSYALGEGAFISGYGNYFTIFFNTIGESHNISTKTALVISGEKTSNGIKNLKYAFIMVEKGADPQGLLMKEGVFRVFEDGDYISSPITWSHSSKAKLVTPFKSSDEYSIYSAFKK